MLEYNIPAPDNPESMKPLLSKNCLCWNPGVIFNEKGNKGEKDNFRREFEDNLEQGFAGQEVCSRLQTCVWIIYYFSERLFCGPDHHILIAHCHFCECLCTLLVSELSYMNLNDLYQLDLLTDVSVSQT